MEDVAILGATLGIIAIVLTLILVAVGIFMVITTFMIYKKAGVEGWKCLIPYYNTWTECKFLGLNTNWVWILLGVSFVGGFLNGLLDTSLFSLVIYAASLYFSVLRSISMAQSW